MRHAGHALLLLLASGCATLDDGPADPAARLDWLVRGYEEIALWDDGATATPPRKWTQSLRVRFAGIDGGGFRQVAETELRQMAEIAGLRIDTVVAEAGRENFLIEFAQDQYHWVQGRSAGCLAYSRWNTAGELQHVRLVLDFKQGSALRQCIIHELMHGFGFPGHPHNLPTVLSYKYSAFALTPLDRAVLKAHYDLRIRPNATRDAALAAARRHFSEIAAASERR